MTILVVEDDEKIQAFISQGLSQEGHTVETATTGDEGQALWKSKLYDAVILDIMLPGINGLAILKHMRSTGDTTPTLILSAKADVDDRVTGLESGADDYLIKPFSFAELTARLHALTRRTHAAAGPDPTVLKVADVTLDLVRHNVVRATKKITLQPREFALLELLMRNAGKPLAKSTIFEHIWGSAFDPQTNIVDVLICRLRNKIDSGFDKKRILTIRGIGYVFRTDD